MYILSLQCSDIKGYKTGNINLIYYIYSEQIIEYNVGTFTIIDGSYGETCFF